MQTWITGIKSGEHTDIYIDLMPNKKIYYLPHIYMIDCKDLYCHEMYTIKKLKRVFLLVSVPVSIPTCNFFYMFFPFSRAENAK